MNQYEMVAQAKELLAQEDGAKGLVVGTTVYEPLFMSRNPNHPACQSSKCLYCKPIRFTARQYLFLQAYRTGTPVAEAAARVGMTSDQAIRFMKLPKTQAWMEDKLRKDATYRKWNTATEAIAEIDKVYRGEEEKTREQMEALKMLFTLIRPERGGSDSDSTRITINIDPGAVQEAFRRQNAIDGEISQAS